MWNANKDADSLRLSVPRRNIATKLPANVASGKEERRSRDVVFNPMRSAAEHGVWQPPRPEPRRGDVVWNANKDADSPRLSVPRRNIATKLPANVASGKEADLS